MSELGRTPVLIDTVEGISHVITIHNIDQLHIQKAYTLHDFDLGVNLKIMQKMGMLDSVTILGVPMHGNKERIKKELIEKLRLISKEG